MGKSSRRKKEKRKHASSAPQEPAWKYAEKIVERLEKCLAPDAKVERNQMLPSLLTGHERQCDVIILRNSGPRQTLTIVEVQNRGKKVEIGDYGGWCQKRDEVGANCVICVSEQGFPESVITHAKTQRDRVRLLTLSELQGEHWPVHIVGKEMRFVEVGTELVNMQPVIDSNIVRPNKTVKIKNETPIFRLGSSNRLLSSLELSRKVTQLQPEFQHLPVGVVARRTIFRTPPGTHFDITLDGETTPLNAVIFDVKLHVKRLRIPLSCSDYVQYDHHGELGDALAYAITGEGDVSGQHVRCSLIFTAESSGLLHLADCQIEGLPPDSVRMSFFTEDPWKNG